MTDINKLELKYSNKLKRDRIMEERKTIGQKLSPILEEIEATLIDHSAYNGDKPDFTDAGFRAGVKIFMDVMVDKMLEVQMNEKKTIEESLKEVELMAYSIRSLILQYTKIDTHDLYK